MGRKFIGPFGTRRNMDPKGILKDGLLDSLVHWSADPRYSIKIFNKAGSFYS